METTQNKEGVFKSQVLPIGLTALTCLALIALLYGEILILNRFTDSDIALTINWVDILVGLTIYLKTSIDFAIFIGNLMRSNTGWKSRISIELGTAAGNALGTMAILLIWTFFKEISWLLALMILVASLVLFRLAEDGLEHALHTDRTYPRFFKKLVRLLESFLNTVNRYIKPVLGLIMPNISMKAATKVGFWSLFGFAFMVPFILGLDDFAGYVPLFTVVNVFGFSVGVFVAHAILNMLLYISPERTIRAVKNPLISFFGSLAFVGLGIWGLIEAVRLLFGLH